MNTPFLEPCLAADKVQLSSFANPLFCYEDAGTFVDLRAFYDDKSEPFRIKSHRLSNDMKALKRAVTLLADQAARQTRLVVFCPPIATFSSRKANEASLVNGLALSVECDQQPAWARTRLEQMLGPATVVVASGGEWLDPATGKLQAKSHLHWRLNEPTRAPEDPRLLKQARTLATSLVGGDASNKPIAHPIRWPGSWHRNGAPRGDKAFRPILVWRSPSLRLLTLIPGTKR